MGGRNRLVSSYQELSRMESLILITFRTRVNNNKTLFHVEYVFERSETFELPDHLDHTVYSKNAIMNGFDEKLTVMITYG
uniref:Uncharacterized protein n=1 Tax=Onchocerca volvulus TaxID=6282 RepID=A0A8R1XVJ2_ONCVO